jgi:hypothetical protein
LIKPHIATNKHRQNWPGSQLWGTPNYENKS